MLSFRESKSPNSVQQLQKVIKPLEMALLSAISLLFNLNLEQTLDFFFLLSFP